jgi:LPS-assembly protein
MISKLIFRKIIFVVFISFIFTPVIFASNEVDISADQLEYDEREKRLVAQGHVVLNWDNRKVFADYVEFLIDKKSMTASGGVTIEEGGSIVHSENIVYNYNDETGKIKEMFISSSNLLFMHSKSMKKISKDIFNLKNITFSNCDLDEPHSYFRANRGKLVLNKRLTIYNAVFYIGKIPLFYLPFITKSLKDARTFGSRLRVTVEPGYTNIEGFTLKTTVSCALSENSNISVNYDYLGRRGDGYGGNFSYVPRAGMLDIKYYTSRDLIEDKERWVFRPNYTQKLNNKWTIRSKGEFISDHDFYNYYNQSNWERTANYLQSYVSLTRSGSKASTELNFDYNSKYNPNTSKYEATSINLPRLTVTFYQRTLGLGIMHKPYFEYGNFYRKYNSKIDPFYKNMAQFRYNINKNFKVGRRFSLTPGLEISNNWYDKDDNNQLKNACLTHYGGTFNTRFRVLSWMDWNAKYTARAITKPNSLGIDTSLRNYGIELNNVSLRNDMLIGERITVENRITYNLTHDRNSTPVRWSPLYTDLNWFPKYNVNVLFQQSQLIDPQFKFNSLNATIGIKEYSTNTFFNLGMFYQHYTNPSQAYMNKRIRNTIGFGLWLTPKWRFDYNIRNIIAFDNITYSRLNDHELKIYRDSHCYKIGIIYTKRLNIEDKIEFKYDLKTNMPFSKRSNNLGYDDNEPTEIFYPWQEWLSPMERAMSTSRNL